MHAGLGKDAPLATAGKRFRAQANRDNRLARACDVLGIQDDHVTDAEVREVRSHT